MCRADPESGEIDALADSTDVLPTLIELCGLKPPADADWDGLGLAPLVRGEERPELAERRVVVRY